jgi:hypothetical protein
MSGDVHILDPETGFFVSMLHMEIAELIKDYDPTLSLVFIPAAARACNEEFPFAILHSPVNHAPYIVRKLRENEVNVQLVAWLWMNDQERAGNNPLQALQKQEEAQRALELKRRQDERDESMDIAKHILDGKNYYRHNGKTYS